MPPLQPARLAGQWCHHLADVLPSGAPGGEEKRGGSLRAGDTVDPRQPVS